MRLKYILLSTGLWLAIVGLLFLVQIVLDGMALPDSSLNELLNTVLYGLVILSLIWALQRWPKFPPVFDTKWYLFHIVLSAFSYLIFESLFVELRLEPNSSFVSKSSSLGSSYIDQVLGNGFGIYVILILIFAWVNRGNKVVRPAINSPSTPLDQIKVKLANRTYFVAVDDILFIRSAQNYSELFTEDGKHVVRETLSNLDQTLDQDRFIRIHRSTIINRHEIAEFLSSPNGQYKAKLKNGEVLSIGNKFKKQVLAQFQI